MSAPLEHDYIGLSEASSMEKPSKSPNISSEIDRNLKATELRLGLPGLGQDLEENACKNSHVVNNVAAGGKRGFFDVSFDGSGLDGKKKTEHSVSAIVEEKKKSCVNGESCRVTPVAANCV
ncbi:putative AUX/IAA protein [Helianthus annuus]|nr:putative AUX/IAA protein [Helianthus annuus]